MKIITAFDSYKGCMSATEACRAAKEGILSIYPNAEVVCLPMSDGGEGLVDCIAEALPVERISIKVHGPLMEEVIATYAVSAKDQTAYMEMASASGLPLVPMDKRNPLLTTTFGVGEMIWDAVQRGYSHIIMGIGGSATCDGGKGMIDFLRPHLPVEAKVVVASDVNNPLYGTNGAAYVFAPQKGATPEQVVTLDQRLRDFALETENAGFASHELATHPGAGAAGGLGYGLMAYLGASLQSGIDLVLDTIEFDSQMEGADLILTGEGKSDRQTLMGKVPHGILKRATSKGIPVHILSGAIEDKDKLLAGGFTSIHSINQGEERPLEVLMRKEVAMENLKKTIANYIKF